MRSVIWASIGAIIFMIGGCGGKTEAPTQQEGPAQHIDPSKQAEEAIDQVAILFKDVRVSSYDVDGKASQCSLLYNVLNKTKYHVYSIYTAAGPYSIFIGDFSANTHYIDDQTLLVDAADGSCLGVAEKLIETGSNLGTTKCQMEALAEGDCQGRVKGYVAVDASTKVRLQVEEEAQVFKANAAKEQQFEIDKAQAWSDRGQFELPIGSILVQNPSYSQTTIAVVLAPDFDPTKLDPTVQVSTSVIPFCAADASAITPPIGAVKIIAATRDQYGLSVWYKMSLKCPGIKQYPVWITSADVNQLVITGQIKKS